MKAKKRIRNLEELEAVAQSRKSVICLKTAFSNRPVPAAFLIGMQGRYLLNLFRKGVYIYEKTNKKKGEKKCRKKKSTD